MIVLTESQLVIQPISSSDVTDELLARQAREGDLSAVDTLARRWQRPLTRFLERRVGSRADAEDLFQETFVRVVRHLDDYDDRRAFKTWLFTIAWRLAANHLRDRRRCVGPDALGELPGNAADPAESADEQDLRSNLWGTARRVLSEDQYAILWMFYVEQFPPRQIAGIMNKSWVAVKTALHRARKSLEPHVTKFRKDGVR